MKCMRKSRRYRIAQLKFLALLAAFGFLAGCGSDLGTDLTTDTASTTTATDSTTTATDEVLARRGDDGGRTGDGQRDSDGGRDGDRPLPYTETRTIDGTDNNFAGLGSTGLAFAEDVTRAYGDGVGSHRSRYF